MGRPRSSSSRDSIIPPPEPTRSAQVELAGNATLVGYAVDHVDHRPYREDSGTRGVHLPDFLIIGAMKCGTTSLYSWLGRHPRIAPTNPKEIHFFDHNRNYRQRGERWYRAHFPPGDSDRTWITGEATPAYLFDPRCAGRIASMVPEAKLIVLLRDPVNRAVSHWNHQHARGREHDDLHTAMLRVMGSDTERATNSEELRAKRDDYPRRGLYAEQLERWWAHYAQNRILVLHSKQLFADPRGILDQVCAFLDLPPLRPLPEFTARGVGSYRSGIDETTRQLLVDYYRLHNERLYDLLGTDLGWQR